MRGLLKSPWTWGAAALFALAAALAFRFPESRAATLAWIGEKTDAAASNLITVLVTAIATILGIHLTNKGNADRAALQFEHERAAAATTRTFDLKREALLQAAEALQARLVSLGMAARMDVSEMDIMNPTEKQSAALARAYAVASDSTFLALHRAQSVLTLAGGKVIIHHRIYATGKASAVQTFQAGLDRLLAERAAHLRWLQDPTIMRDPRDPVVRQLQDRINHLDRVEPRQRDMLLEAQLEAFEMHARVAHAVVLAARECEPAVIQAILAIRRDLGVGQDEAALTASLTDALDENATKARGLLSELDAIIKGLGKEPTDAASGDGQH